MVNFCKYRVDKFYIYMFLLNKLYLNILNNFVYISVNILLIKEFRIKIYYNERRLDINKAKFNTNQAK